MPINPEPSRTRLDHLRLSKSGSRLQRLAVTWLGGFLLLLLAATNAAAHPVAQEADGVHIVLPGENLTQIAEEYGTTPEYLRQLNNLNNADLIWVGLPLRLPVAQSSGDAAEGALDSEEAAIDGEAVLEYTVRAGDTISSIARAHRTGVAQLIALNRISPGQRLSPGRQLLVPRVRAAAPVAGEALKEGERIHIVQAGESLGSIAARYETSARNIAGRNELSNAGLIVPGQRLIVPPASFVEKSANLPLGEDGFHIHDEVPTRGKWIDVDLSEQRVVAYVGEKPVRSFWISSGKGGTPTVTGEFRIWAKTPIQDMYGGSRAAGDYYYLPGVQWVQYFYEDYAFHGTYWHTNFGAPASRGCINMTNEDAKWLFEWASPEAAPNGGWIISDDENPGTLVIVHQ